MTAVASGAVVIVATCRDGSRRVFDWETAGAGPDNTWTRLSAIVDRNVDETDLAPHAIIRIQAANLEPWEHASGARRP